ncbi:hypothetical protein [Desulfovibrio sp.]|uniref:hypothetical protein n=1 Tax=Desulfovibrio sp. TaxID=885 RepID=UPI0025B89255|nr:hypothetical protein [Desulfovibrio sp.]
MKKVIGGRLRSNGRYAPILEEKPRCWRLNYAGEFHLDITPSIKNPGCPAGGELVPDKKLQEWKPSNPKGFKALFDLRAALQPRIGMRKAAAAMDRAMEEVAPFPEQARLKGVLRRTVQLAKRHRDVYFETDKTGSAPISIIITTLAARSYEHCVQQFEYDTEFDLLSDIVRLMPNFIETREVRGGCIEWYVWNETTAGENFAEKWNAKPQLAAAFFDWHTRFLAQTEAVASAAGLDALTKSLSAGFGSSPVKMAFDQMTKEVSAARTQGKLVLLPSVGLMSGVDGGTAVRRNTFFGAD